MPTSTWAGQEGALYSVPPALGQTGSCLGRWALRPLSLRPMQMWLNSLHLDAKWHGEVRVSQHCSTLRHAGGAGPISW
ncbi:hypothetical protein CesoFtcFv8_014390 [Champsocephalus esox]|uniref:Uncharacterized protein n=1 Tax=Champsocephalus esox TaxID=159716 RepID=A0AAN8GT03_9TELE|nr:hypothetical protein CesoFtcFv8_014390 [Champsocephalus esox]